jgi:hypothetical protein
MEYLDRRACSRLAHFQRGCGAAVPRRAISVFDSCFAHAEQWRLVPVLAPADCHQIGFFSVNSARKGKIALSRFHRRTKEAAAS